MGHQVGDGVQADQVGHRQLVVADEHDGRGVGPEVVQATVRWTLTVSKETDLALRTFLAQRGLKRGDLSRFVEDAVRWQVFQRTVQETRARNAGMPAKEINATVEEALASVRAERFRAAG